jgi:hypothetical protein
MSFTSFGKLGAAVETTGKYHYQYFLKLTTQAPTFAGFFVDCGQAAGIPKYNAYSGSALTATVLTGSGNNGIYTGPTYSGSTKHLLKWQYRCGSSNSVPIYAILLDYLLIYPLIDCDSTDAQDMDNTQTLTRYTDGEGVRIVLIASAPMTTTASLTISYTNSEGVAGRLATYNVLPPQYIGGVASGTGTAGAAGQATPYWPLVDGDKGVRSIESMTFSSGAGGFIVAALVKPIATINAYEADVTSEKVFGFNTTVLPEIKDGAYLNLMHQRGNGTSQTAIVNCEFLFINS